MLARLVVGFPRMRQIVLLVLGIAIGAAGGVSAVNMLRQRDAYARGLMDVMQHHYAALRDDWRRRQCTNPGAHLDTLRTLASEIGSAVYPDDIADSPFREFEARLRNALTASPQDCTALGEQLSKIGASCDDCHRQYR